MPTKYLDQLLGQAVIWLPKQKFRSQVIDVSNFQSEVWSVSIQKKVSQWLIKRHTKKMFSLRERNDFRSMRLGKGILIQK